MKAQGGLPFHEDESLAQVAIAAPLLPTFTYRIPASLAGCVMPGMRVRVRFAGRMSEAVVVAADTPLPDLLQRSTLQPLLDCLDAEPLLPAAVLALCHRIAEDLLVGWGEVLQMALPGGDTAAARRVRAVGGAPAAPTDVERRLLQQLDGQRWRRLSPLVRAVDGGTAAAYRLRRGGHVQIEDEWSGATSGAAVALVQREAGASLPAALQACSRAPAQRRLVQHLWSLPLAPVALATLQIEMGAVGAAVAALERKGLLRRLRGAHPQATWMGGLPSGAGALQLTAEQAAALASIEAALQQPSPPPLLLHGVTGSGKTEVYLRAAQRALASGRTALLLVPEIGLTPQLQARAREVFGDLVAVTHSGMAAGERQQAWWRARRDEAKVVVGPRSAVFAPLDGVGLIVVDEEQDSAYKQDERPRYLGREVAWQRARIEGAVLLLGSATPSVESYHVASSGPGRLLRMPTRVASRSLPIVELVDMRQEWRVAGRSMLSRRLETAIADRLQRGEQVLLLLNRRGFAAAMLCRACGARVQCPDCAVSLTWHRGRGALVCHYCDHSEPTTTACPQCGAGGMHEMGQGTERLQAALQRRFDGARIERFDADQTRQRGSHARILGSFAAGEIDILVGTQMLAKGHDFPGVTLVGVVGADAALGMPDFRAAERTFQLLTQMAGRAGRGDLAGEVVLQVHEADHYAIAAAAAHDYETFFARELEYRRRLAYPPFVALAACLCRGKVAAVAAEEAGHVAGALREAAAGRVTVVGPAAPPLARLRGAYRMQVLLKAESRAVLVGTLRAARDLLGAQRRLPRDLVIDVDPQSLM